MGLRVGPWVNARKRASMEAKLPDLVKEQRAEIRAAKPKPKPGPAPVMEGDDELRRAALRAGKYRIVP